MTAVWLFFGDIFLFWLSNLAFVGGECLLKTSSANCSSPCSLECPKGPCDHVTGNCSLCDRKHQKDQCNESVYKPNYWPVAVGLVAALIILAIVLWRCRRMIAKHKSSGFKPAPTSSVLEENKSSANQLSTPELERRPTICQQGRKLNKSSVNTSYTSVV